MAGTLIPLMAKRSFDFSHNKPDGSVQTFAICERIDVSNWKDGILVVRAHSANIDASGQIVVSLAPDGWSDEDPGINFLSSSTFVMVACPRSGPGLATGGSTGILGHFAWLAVSGLTTSAGVPVLATISVDLALRNPDP